MTDLSFLKGATGSATLIVSDDDLATALGSGDVPVLGTPRLVALAEEATVNAVAGRLPDGITTVGTRIEMDHLRPNRMGEEVGVTAAVIATDGRRITFAVEANDGSSIVGRGTITRVAVDAAAFGRT